MTEKTFREALREAMASEMRRDEDVFLLGENIATWGGSQKVTTGLVDEFGKERVIETPVSENAIVGSALGAALDGKRPVAELYQGDFFFTAGNEVINDIPKWRYQHRREEELPVTLRAPMGMMEGGGAGPEHSQCPEAFLHHAPGLTIIAPGTPKDAYGLLKSAIRCGDPIVFLEHKKLYNHSGEVPDDSEFTVPLDEAKIRRQGSDVTIIAWAWMLQEALNAAEQLAAEGIDAEVVDPRTIKPLDFQTIYQSVEQTGSLLVVEESPRTGSVSAEIITRVCENGLPLANPPQRLTYPNIPNPYPPHIESHYMPSTNSIIDAVEELLE